MAPGGTRFTTLSKPAAVTRRSKSDEASETPGSRRRAPGWPSGDDPLQEVRPLTPVHGDRVKEHPCASEVDDGDVDLGLATGDLRDVVAGQRVAAEVDAERRPPAHAVLEQRPITGGSSAPITPRAWTRGQGARSGPASSRVTSCCSHGLRPRAAKPQREPSSRRPCRGEHGLVPRKVAPRDPVEVVPVQVREQLRRRGPAGRTAASTAR